MFSINYYSCLYTIIFCCHGNCSPPPLTCISTICLPFLSLSSAGALMIGTRPLKKKFRLTFKVSSPAVRPWQWRAKERAMKWNRCSRTCLEVATGETVWIETISHNPPLLSSPLLSSYSVLAPFQSPSLPVPSSQNPPLPFPQRPSRPPHLKHPLQTFSSALVLPGLHPLIQCRHERPVSECSREVPTHIQVHHWFEVLETALLEEAKDVDLQRAGKEECLPANTLFNIASRQLLKKYNYGLLTNSVATILHHVRLTSDCNTTQHMKYRLL